MGSEDQSIRLNELILKHHSGLLLLLWTKEGMKNKLFKD